MIWKECGWKWLWSNLCDYFHIRRWVLRKTIKNLRQNILFPGRDSNHESQLHYFFKNEPLGEQAYSLMWKENELACKFSNEMGWKQYVPMKRIYSPRIIHGVTILRTAVQTFALVKPQHLYKSVILPLPGI
jgi:hypothetical protein